SLRVASDGLRSRTAHDIRTVVVSSERSGPSLSVISVGPLAFALDKGAAMQSLRLASFTTLLASSLSLAVPAAAQTSDDLFDPTVLHDIQLTMKPGDWDSLQAYYVSDTYYPAGMKGRGGVVGG